MLEGIKNSIFKKEDIEKIAEERMSICNTCPLKGDKCLVAGTAPCCNACGCSLQFKLRSLSSFCPHPDGPKWEAVLTQEEEDTLNNTLDNGDKRTNPE